jgi:sulfur carrier protein ThiS
MPDLKKIFLFSKNKDYVDVTRLSSEHKKRSSQRKMIFPRFRAKPIKIKKVKRLKPLLKIKIPKTSRKVSQAPKAIVKVIKASKTMPKAAIKAAKPVVKAPKEILAGEVTHFFDKIQVCVIKVKKPLKLSDKLHFRGKAVDFIQLLDSMQINHQQVAIAKNGDEIGLKVKQEVRPGDKVFIVPA